MEAKSTAVRREVFIEASVETVWSALSNADERNRWETRSCSLDLQVGGHVSFDYGWGVKSTGTIKELIPYRRMTIQDPEDESLTIWTLEAEKNGTRVAVEYTGLWLGDQGHMIMENMAFGTKLFLLNLKSILEENNDIRSKFWRNWLAMNHTSIRADHYEQFGVEEGVLVLKVKEDSPIAEQLVAQDIILDANHQPISTYEDLELLLTELEPEQKLPLTVLRNGVKLQIELALLPYPVAYTA